jgi:hypothetical protein
MNMSIPEHMTPFGDTDAARSRSVEKIEIVGSEGYVTFNDANQGGITYGDENRFRVIIGKKGSGKTLYLRRSYIKLKGDSIYKEEFDHQPKPVIENMVQTRPRTDLILRFSQLFNGEFLTEKWRELWRRAIIRTLITHILYSNK